MKKGHCMPSKDWAWFKCFTCKEFFKSAIFDDGSCELVCRNCLYEGIKKEIEEKGKEKVVELYGLPITNWIIDEYEDWKKMSPEEEEDEMV